MEMYKLTTSVGEKQPYRAGGAVQQAGWLRGGQQGGEHVPQHGEPEREQRHGGQQGGQREQGRPEGVVEGEEGVHIRPQGVGDQDWRQPGGALGQALHAFRQWRWWSCAEEEASEQELPAEDYTVILHLTNNKLHDAAGVDGAGADPGDPPHGG